MTTLTEGKHAGGFLVWEVLRDYTRETVTIASGAGKLEPGTVLGKITTGGKYTGLAPAATNGSQNSAGILWAGVDATDSDAPEQQVPERRDMRAFVCRQFKKQDVLWASEIQGIRDFGSETATQQVQTEVARKMARLRNDAEATFEFHLFNGIQGVVKDPKDGATVIDYYTEFGITPAAEVDFDLDNASPASGALRKRCQALIESVEDSLGGLAAGQVQLRAECGSAFFADLVAHKEVRETYLNTAAAADLRGRVGEEVSFGGITFRRYRGGLGFGVPTDKAYFYPEGVEGLFEIYYAPADTFETVNTLGLPLYARMIPDRDRDEWVRLEIESNPLPICTRPQVLRSAKRT